MNDITLIWIIVGLAIALLTAVVWIVAERICASKGFWIRFEPEKYEDAKT